MGLEIITLGIIFGIVIFWLYKSVSDYMSEQSNLDREDLTSFYDTKAKPEPAQPVKRGRGRPRKSV